MITMIVVLIQLISKPEMTVKQAEEHIARYFPGIDADTFSISSNADTGVVSLTIHQWKLTDEQRDWLHMTPFAARYIDSYKVEIPKSNRKPFNDRAGYVASRKNALTNIHNVIYVASEAGIGADFRYVTVCEAHGTMISSSSLPDARIDMKDASKWCEACSLLTHGLDVKA